MPRANGTVERFMQTMMKTIRCSFVEQKPWKQDLYELLRNYRSTPHCTTQKTPASLIFAKPVMIGLSDFSDTTLKKDEEIRKRNDTQKNKMKNYFDTKTEERTLCIGDSVIEG